MSYSEHKALKRAMKVIAKEFANYFSDLVVKTEGTLRPHPESISIQSIVIKNIVGRGRQLHLVEVHFNSDVGLGHSGRLFLKVFRDNNKLAEEAKGAKFLYDSLNQNSYITTPKLLYFSHEYSILVYEGLYADELDKFQNISDQERFFIAGASLAVISSYSPPPIDITLKQIDLQRYYLLLEKTLDNLFEIGKTKSLKISDRLENIRELMVSNLEEYMFYAFGGTHSFGDYHAGNLMITDKILQTTQQPTQSKNYENIFNQFQVYVIDPEFLDPDADQTDRFEDIAAFFVESLLNEYANSSFKSANETRAKILLFFQGYDFIFKQDIKTLSFLELYPRGLTLNFQFGMAILFDLLFFIRTAQSEKLQDGIEFRLRLVIALIKYNLLDL